MKLPFRVGYGYDVHRLVEGRRLMLCGVEVAHSLGLLGHSDADVAIHALCDALLGAAALRDIGFHFPDSAAEFKDADSCNLLLRVCTLIREKGYEIGNFDITIAAQKPKLSPYIDRMRERLAEVCGIDADCVSVKATTTEHLGFEGREEGISATAVVMLYRSEYISS